MGCFYFGFENEYFDVFKFGTSRNFMYDVLNSFIFSLSNVVGELGISFYEEDFFDDFFIYFRISADYFRRYVPSTKGLFLFLNQN